MSRYWSQAPPTGTPAANAAGSRISGRAVRTFSPDAGGVYGVEREESDSETGEDRCIDCTPRVDVRPVDGTHVGGARS